MKNKKILLLAPIIAAGCIMATQTRSNASILDSFTGLFDSALGIVTDAFEDIAGAYVTKFVSDILPDGFGDHTGAFGLPDPGGLFGDIDDKAAKNETESNDTVAGDLEKTQLAADTTEALGSSVLSQEGQEAGKAVSDAATSAAKKSSDVAKKCQGTDITQEAVKCANAQLATNAELLRMAISQNQQMLHQDAVGNVTQSHLLQRANEEAREQQAEIEESARQSVEQAEFSNALVDGLSEFR